MTLPISDDLALLAVSAARYEADGSPDAMICLRLEVESIWEKVRSSTQATFDAFRADARAEFQLQLAKDRA
jgi:hypothetical protein